MDGRRSGDEDEHGDENEDKREDADEEDDEDGEEQMFIAKALRSNPHGVSVLPKLVEVLRCAQLF